MTAAPLQLGLNIDPHKIKENNFCDEILSLLKAVRPSWAVDDINKHAIKSKEFTGGISNQLYGYYEDGKFDKDVVLVRIFGAGTELMLDRKRECQNIQVLSAAGRAPPLYAIFTNGISYGFANGVTLDTESIRDPTIRKLIAEEMIRMHKIQPEGMEVKTGLWDKLTTFLDLSEGPFLDPEKQKQFEATIKPISALRQEVEVLKAHLESLGSPIVFCHNDLLLKNIIYNEKKGTVTFIDHEYAMYNYEHFDIGNHFDEYAGVDNVDFSLYPDKTYQLVWLRHYLEQKAIADGRSPADVTDADVELHYVITNKFALAGHMFWGIWGLVQARHSLIDFGFLDYAGKKLGEYFARKDEFFAL